MKTWTARLAFGSPDLSISLLFATVNGWLLFFLVSIIGMSPLLAGALFVVGRLLDGLLDPMIGALTDRHGRKRVIMWALPVAACAFVGLWLAPSLVDSQATQGAVTIAVFAVFALAYTCVSVPRLGMLPEFAPGYDERTDQACVDTGFVFVAVLISSVAFPVVVTQAGGGIPLSQTAASTWISVSLGIAVLAILAYLPFILAVHEPGHRRRAHPTRPLILATLRQLAATPGAIRSVCLFGLSVLALVGLQSMLPFWLEAGPGVSAGELSVVLLCVFLATLISLPVWAVLSRRLGKELGMRAGACLLLAGVGLAMCLPQGAGLGPLLMLAACVAGFGVGALSMFPWSIVPDVAEAHSHSLNAPVEGTTTAVFTMTNKAAVAVALWLNAVVLELSGLVEGAAVPPPMLLILPAGFACAVAVLARKSVSPRRIMP